MSLIYVSDPGSIIGISGNRFTVKYKDGRVRSIASETVEGITLFGVAQLTTQCMEECMKRGIPVAFLSKGGRYFGRLVSTGHMKAELQRKQSALYDTDFSLELSKLIIKAKIRNQQTVLRRYSVNKRINIEDCIHSMKVSEKKIEEAGDIQELIGHEGQAAKFYFKGLSRCIKDEFRFNGRSKRPPRDEFNSMISLGYSILMNELYSEIEAHGLNPYFGFLHRDAEKHPTLASDLMEEWRAVLIDSTVMSMINGHEIQKENFYTDNEEPGCFIDREGLKAYLKKLENKFYTKTRYLSYTEDTVSFRYAISLQIDRLVRAITEEDPTLYCPIMIR